MNTPIEATEKQVKILESLIKNPSAVLTLVAVAFGFGVTKIYEDLRASNEIVIELIRMQVKESQSVTDALSALSHQIEKSTDEK